MGFISPVCLRRERWFEHLTCVHSWPRSSVAATMLAVASMLLLSPAAHGDSAASATGEPSAPIVNSALDDRLMYQLLVAEMALAQGDTGTAFEWMLDAARRTRDEGLFRRSTDVALHARAGDQALAASRAWRLARPESTEALRTQLQILVVMRRIDSLGEPLRQLLAQTPAPERAALLAALPGLLQRAGEPSTVAALLEEALKPYRQSATTREAAAVALGRIWLEAGDIDRAWALAQEGFAASQQSPGAPGPALLALELMPRQPLAEAALKRYLDGAAAEPRVRLAYARVLAGSQRYTEAIRQLETITREDPGTAAPYLTLGALHLELKHPKEAQTALLRFVALAHAAGSHSPRDPMAAAAGGESEDGDERADHSLSQAWLMLAQAAEQLGDFNAAESWLARVDDPAQAVEVQTRRAKLLVRQGRLGQALDFIRALPEALPQQARAKQLAEVSVLREGKRWLEAYQLLGATQKQFGEDADLLYEQSMMAERAGRLDDMENLLLRVIALKPNNAHAYNALGYSLAERNLRLPEARQLIQKALELSPGDPFITDSLGWVEFKLGNLEEALRLLRQAWNARPDTEIGAHLGEVLWWRGQRDEARHIWREARQRDRDNDVLHETLKRLRADL
jgi:tetratricopeptide (TPR) repeat protein